jgi:hypothetical protein
MTTKTRHPKSLPFFVFPTYFRPSSPPWSKFDSVRSTTNFISDIFDVRLHSTLFELRFQ